MIINDSGIHTCRSYDLLFVSKIIYNINDRRGFSLTPQPINGVVYTRYACIMLLLLLLHHDVSENRIVRSAATGMRVRGKLRRKTKRRTRRRVCYRHESVARDDLSVAGASPRDHQSVDDGRGPTKTPTFCLCRPAAYTGHKSIQQRW